MAKETPAAKVVDNGKNIAECTIPEAKEFIANLWASMPPEDCPAVGMIGPPGVGKTSIINQIGRETYTYGAKKHPTIITRHLSQVHPLDMGGVGLDSATRTMYYAKPPLVDEVMAIDGVRALNLDELDRAQAIVQSASLQVLLEKKQNGYKLENTYVCFCANGHHAQYTNELDSALSSRAVLMHVRSDANRWLNWAADQQVDVRVMLTIAQQPNVLNEHGSLGGVGDDTDAGKATGAIKVADERSWHMLSTALKAGVSTSHAEKFVGKHAASKFELYSRINKDFSKEVAQAAAGKMVNVDRIKGELSASALNQALFCIYLAAGGQIRDIKIARDYMSNGMTQLDKERIWIASKMITYNIKSEVLCEDDKIREMHEEMLAAVTGTKV